MGSLFEPEMPFTDIKISTLSVFDCLKNLKQKLDQEYLDWSDNNRIGRARTKKRWQDYNWISSENEI